MGIFGVPLGVLAGVVGAVLLPAQSFAFGGKRHVIVASKAAPSFPGAGLLSRAQFDQYQHEGRISIQSPSALERAALIQASQTGMDLVAIQALNSLNPSLFSKLMGPTDLSVNSTPTRVAMSPAVTASAMAQALRQYPTQANQLALYSLIHRAEDPAVAQVSGYSAAQLSALVRQALSNWTWGGARPRSTPDLYNRACDGDVGTGQGGDSDASSSSKVLSVRHSSVGVYAQFDWPLKTHFTCVKAQLQRGTCAAFSTIAAVEAVLHQKTGRYYNLSEQALYSKARLIWQQGASATQEDLNLDVLLPSALLEGYTIPLESAWDYNRSPDRVVIGPGPYPRFAYSCSRYSETCSDTAHQARWVCVAGDWSTCGYLYPLPSPVSGAKITGFVQAWDLTDVDGSIGVIEALLDVGTPVLIGVNILSTMDEVGGDGYVQMPQGTANRGGHFLPVSGYILNSQLQAQLPTAPPGAGGGYLIVRNSWGLYYGDAGYIYLPFDYMKNFGFAAFGLTDVLPQ